MINTYKIPGAVKLFRYDIECPPDNWNTDFKNKEYVYSDDCEDLRIKNRIGAFYFFENKATAYSTGCLAAQNNRCTKIWLTETSIIQEIQLLDLSQFENISSLLLSFDELGFDILTDKFHQGFPLHCASGQPYDRNRKPVSGGFAVQLLCHWS